LPLLFPQAMGPKTLWGALLDDCTKASPRTQETRHGGYIAAGNRVRVGSEGLLGRLVGVVYLLLVPLTDADAR
jgi:hypothetical protein